MKKERKWEAEAEAEAGPPITGHTEIVKPEVGTRPVGLYGIGLQLYQQKQELAYRKIPLA